MTLYPEVVIRAQKEIDEVVGSDRLPTFKDWPHFPYINAFVKEVSPVNGRKSTKTLTWRS